MKLKNNKGFTMVELLIVLAIIAILAAVAIPIYSSQLENSRIKVDESNLRAATGLAAQDYIVRNAGETIVGGTQDKKMIYTVYALIDSKNPKVSSQNMAVYPGTGHVGPNGEWKLATSKDPLEPGWFKSVIDMESYRQNEEYSKTGINSTNGKAKVNGKDVILFPIQQNGGKAVFEIEIGLNGVILKSGIIPFGKTKN